MKTMSVPFEAGYRRFRATRAVSMAGYFAEIEKECIPQALVVTCIDGRVDPAMIFDFAPGECMIVRTVGAMVPPPGIGTETIASAVDLAVRQDGARDVVVLGHSRCRAAAWPADDAPSEALSAMLSEAAGQVGAVGSPDRIEKILVGLSVRNLRCYLGSGCADVRLFGLWFDIGRARLEKVVDA